MALMVRCGHHRILVSLVLQCRVLGRVLLSMSMKLEFDLLTLLMLLQFPNKDLIAFEVIIAFNFSCVDGLSYPLTLLNDLVGESMALGLHPFLQVLLNLEILI